MYVAKSVNKHRKNHVLKWVWLWKKIIWQVILNLCWKVYSNLVITCCFLRYIFNLVSNIITPVFVAKLSIYQDILNFMKSSLLTNYSPDLARRSGSKFSHGFIITLKKIVYFVHCVSITETRRIYLLNKGLLLFLLDLVTGERRYKNWKTQKLRRCKVFNVWSSGNAMWRRRWNE